MAPPLKILFVSHEASRTGAPLSLLKIVRYIVGLNVFDIKILVRSAGILEKEFSSLAPAQIYYKKIVKKNLMDRIFYNIFRGRDREKIKSALFKTWKPNIVYANTASNGEIMEIAHSHGVPVIAHVRELAGEIKTMPKKEIERLVTIPVHYIVNSESVGRGLRDIFSIPSEKISHIRNFIDADAVDKLADKMESSVVKKRLDIAPDTFIVGGAGKISRRKGVDYFLDIAQKIVLSSPQTPVKFVWVGELPQDPFTKEMIERAGEGVLKDRIIFTGVQENPYPYYKIFDFLLVTSREEPFGNVVIETGLLEKPFICFDESGGPKEFVEKGWGFAVKNFDVDEMAEKTKELLLNADLRQELGERARRAVRGYYTAEQSMPQIISLINRFADYS